MDSKKNIDFNNLTKDQEDLLEVLAQNLGHDINNVLTIAYGNVGLLKRMFQKEERPDSDIKKLEKISNSLNTIRNLIDDLRDYQGPQSGSKEEAA